MEVNRARARVNTLPSGLKNFRRSLRLVRVRPSGVERARDRRLDNYFLWHVPGRLDLSLMEDRVLRVGDLGQPVRPPDHPMLVALQTCGYSVPVNGIGHGD